MTKLGEFDADVEKTFFLSFAAILLLAMLQ